MTYAATAAQHMLESQVLTGAMLNEDVLKAVASVDRSLFVPAAFREAAYVDAEVPMGEGRQLMEPLVFTRMVDVAGISKSDTVLVVACGSGYGAAVVAQLAAKVVGLESNQSLVTTARKNLVTLGIKNATIVESPLVEGFFPASPYDVIIIEGCSELIPQAYADQLKESGKLITVENLAGDLDGSRLGKIVQYSKTRGALNRSEVYDAAASVIGELKMPAEFVF